MVCSFSALTSPGCFARGVPSLLLLLAATALAGGGKKSSKHAKGTIVLNGVETEVGWTDGDSFKLKSGEYKGRGTRLEGYNTLEAFGPVHAWGEWKPAELYELAKASSQVLAGQQWVCTTDGKEDGYRRLLVSCPEATKEIIRKGHAMVYAVEGTKADPALLAVQKEAQAARAGMWAKGVPKGIVSSLHSVGEDGDGKDTAYNRVVDTRTGEALKRKHSKTYETCQTVCEETDGDSSCMVYVPFKRRYQQKPDCLR